MVTGTFAHTAVETIELHVEGLAEPIRCTPNHPFWSPTRQEFVEAADLGHSDLVQGLQGLHRITQIKRIPTPVRVYNLEVHGQHVYQVSHFGFIVHNAPCPIPRSEAYSVAQLEKLKLQYAADEILNANRVGSGLKKDVGHRAASYLSREQLEAGRLFPLRGGDGVQRQFLQTLGELDGKTGVFEYIIDANGTITHQRFKPYAVINGVPN